MQSTQLPRLTIQPCLFGEAPILCNSTAVATIFDVELIRVFGDGSARGT